MNYGLWMFMDMGLVMVYKPTNNWGGPSCMGSNYSQWEDLSASKKSDWHLQFPKWRYSGIHGGFDNLQWKSGWWYTYPSEKYEFVSWDDEIPNWMEKIKHVPNRQPEINTVELLNTVTEGFTNVEFTRSDSIVKVASYMTTKKRI